MPAGPFTVAEVVDTLIAWLRDEAVATFGCERRSPSARAILESGTSADMQITVYREAEHRTGSRGEALRR